jgi:hypothetical protein
VKQVTFTIRPRDGRTAMVKSGEDLPEQMNSERMIGSQDPGTDSI